MSLDCTRGIVWLGISLSLAMPAGAQEALDSLRGERVRATFERAAETREVTGSLADTRGAFLTVESDGEAFPVPHDVLSRVELSRGQNAGRGALRGAGIGLVTGFVGTKLWLDWRYLNDEFNLIGAAIIGAPAGTLLGTLIGAAIGVEEWTTVWVAPDGTGSGASAGLRLELLPVTITGS